MASKQKLKVQQVVIEKLGEKLIVPKAMTLDQAIIAIERQIRFDEETVGIYAEVPGFVLDAAYAFHQALSRKFGWVQGAPTPGFFGDSPPSTITLKTGVDTTVQIPWGRMMIPGIEGYLETGMIRKNGRLLFVIQGEVKHKHEEQVNQIAELTRNIVASESIYRNKAIRIRFTNDSGEQLPMPEPHFMDISQVKPDELVYSSVVEDAIATSIFTPIEKTELVRKAGIPLKRGILMTGPFGVGKTLTSAVTAKKAVENNWTFILCERITELAEVMRFAQGYGPAVLFCEDIDRVTSGDRSIGLDEILNIIDGVEAKASEVMVIFTTNDVDKINQAMLRPGRLDAVIEVSAPDAGAVERLLRLYGRGLINEDEDLTQVSAFLAGNIPAVIREAAERAKLSAIKLMKPGDEFKVTSEALMDAAKTMDMQLQLLKPRVEDNDSERVRAAKVIVSGMKELATSNHVQPVVMHAIEA